MKIFLICILFLEGALLFTAATRPVLESAIADGGIPLIQKKCEPSSRKHKDPTLLASKLIKAVEAGTTQEIAALADCKVMIGQWASTGALYPASETGENVFDQRFTEDEGTVRKRLPFKIIRRIGNQRTYIILADGFRAWDKDLNQHLRLFRAEHTATGWSWTGYFALSSELVEYALKQELKN